MRTLHGGREARPTKLEEFKVQGSKFKVGSGQLSAVSGQPRHSLLTTHYSPQVRDQPVHLLLVGRDGFHQLELGAAAIQVVPFPVDLEVGVA